MLELELKLQLDDFEERGSFLEFIALALSTSKNSS